MGKRAKINTNLSYEELELVGRELQDLAKSKRKKPLVLENSAERRLMTEAEDVFDLMVENLRKELDKILVE